MQSRQECNTHCTFHTPILSPEVPAACTLGLSLRYGVQDSSWEEAYQSNFADFGGRKRSEQTWKVGKKILAETPRVWFDIQAADKQLDPP